MSDQTVISAVVFDRAKIAQVLSAEECALILGAPVTSTGEPQVADHRQMIAFSRGDAFGCLARQLIGQAGIPSLMFLSDQSWTHRRFEALECPGLGEFEEEFNTGSEAWGYDRKYTLLSQTSLVDTVSAIRASREWCLNNLDATADLFRCPDTELLRNCIHGALVTLRPNEDIPEATHGDGPLFFFSVLRSLEDFLYFAIWRNRWGIRNGAPWAEQWVLYTSEQFVQAS